MVWIVYIIIQLRTNTVNGIFWAIICGGVVQVVSVLMGDRAMTKSLSEKQIEGLTNNPNSLGFLMIWAIIAAFFLWGIPGRMQKMIRIGVVVLLPVCGYVMLASGSRKSLLAFIFMVGLWAMWASVVRNDLLGRIGRVLCIAIFIHNVVIA